MLLLYWGPTLQFDITVLVKVRDFPETRHDNWWSCFVDSVINGSTALCWALAFNQCRNHFYTYGKNPWKSYQPDAMPLPTHRITQTQNKCIHKHPGLWVGIESMIPGISAFERAKTVHALDRAVTVIGWRRRLHEANINEENKMKRWKASDEMPFWNRNTSKDVFFMVTIMSLKLIQILLKFSVS
jgi:hypothetical protein